MRYVGKSPLYGALDREMYDLTAVRELIFSHSYNLYFDRESTRLH
jgi:hypothetical protein